MRRSWALPIASVALGAGMLITSVITDVSADAPVAYREYNGNTVIRDWNILPNTPCLTAGGSRRMVPQGSTLSVCTVPTTTTIPATTTTAASTTTTAPTTSTSPSSTSTSLPASTTTVPVPPGLAFQETFSNPLDPARFTYGHGQMDEATIPSPSSANVVGGQLKITSGDQNYGDAVVRINQPFDWAGRVGEFAVDVNTNQMNGGWTQIAISDRPLPYVSFSQDNTAGPYADNAILMQFRANTPACVIMKVYVNAAQTLDNQQCIWDGLPVGPNILNHIQIRMSASGITVIYDGRTLSWSTPIGFSRGYVYLDSHNHATEKYDSLPTITTTWDNAQFDGPVLPALNVAMPPAVLPSGVGDPRLVLLAQHAQFDSNVTLAYRLNNGPSHPITLVRRSNPYQVGAYMVSQAVDPTELVADGTNTVTFTATGMTNPKFTNVQIVWSGAGGPPQTTTTSLTATTTTLAATTTSTAAPPPTTTTAPTTTAPPPAGLLYQNSFSSPSDLDRLVFELHRGAPNAIDSDVRVFNGDHDMSCGAPTTVRTVHESTKSEWVWYCGAPAVADPHFMTGMNTNSYNVISFAPLNGATPIFPGTANEICWNQNLTQLGGRKWINVAVISDDTYNADPGQMVIVNPDHAGNVGTPGFPSDPPGRVVSGDDFLYVAVKNTVTYHSPLGYQFDWTLLEIGADKATRYRNCLKDNGNGTVTRTQARPGGVTNTSTMPGRFPAGPRVFIIEDVSYSPDKDDTQGAVDPYTWHFDQIEISTG